MEPYFDLQYTELSAIILHLSAAKSTHWSTTYAADTYTSNCLLAEYVELAMFSEGMIPNSTRRL